MKSKLKESEEGKSKKHNQKKDKLKKKLHYKKHKKKFKEQRSRLREEGRPVQNLHKLSLISAEFAEAFSGRDLRLMQKILRKLLAHNRQSGREDIETLFESFDGGARIDLSGIEDEYVKRKVFKLNWLALQAVAPQALEGQRHGVPQGQQQHARLRPQTIRAARNRVAPSIRLRVSQRTQRQRRGRGVQRCAQTTAQLS